MSELPIACCLPPDQLAQREREIRALFADALEDVRRETRRLELRFSDSSSGRVEALAEAERRCCAFLTFEMKGTDLVIEAPAGAEETLDGFADLARETLRTT